MILTEAASRFNLYKDIQVAFEPGFSSGHGTDEPEGYGHHDWWLWPESPGAWISATIQFSWAYLVGLCSIIKRTEI